LLDLAIDATGATLPAPSISSSSPSSPAALPPTPSCGGSLEGSQFGSPQRSQVSGWIQLLWRLVTAARSRTLDEQLAVAG
jgi:hypothetical protein